MESNFFIMELWQTGNVGPHNIKKLEGQKKDGYETAQIAKDSMIELKKNGNWNLRQSNHTFTIMELFW